MATCFKKFLRDESGLVVTAELIMIITIAVISLTAGWGAVSQMMASELVDVANSIGSLDQSYSYNGVSAPGHATCSGSGFNDSTNLINISTTSNFNASVAGLDSTNLAEAQVSVAGEPFVLIEEEFGINAQIDETVLLILQQLEIVEIRADGAVILLREDLVEIQTDGSLLIVDEALRVRVEQILRTQQQSLNLNQERIHIQSEVTGQASQADIEAARNELDALRKEAPAAQSGSKGSNSDELRQENARLRELIERLCRESEVR